MKTYRTGCGPTATLARFGARIADVTQMKVLFPLMLVLLLTSFVPAQEKLKDAVDQYRAGNYGAAIEAIEKLNSSAPGNHQSFLYLGAAYAQIGKEKEARAAFLHALKLEIVKNIEGETPLKIKKKKAPSAEDVPDSFQSGSTLLAVEFRPDKTIGFTFVVKTTTNEFIKNCIDVAKKIQFDPATSSGAPVAVIKLVEYTFERY